MLPPEPKRMPANKGTDSRHDPVPANGPAPESAVLSAGVATPPPALSAAPTISTLMHAFRRCWFYALPLACVAALLGAGAVAFVVPPLYVSAMTFRLAMKPPRGSLEDENNFANVQKWYVNFLKSSEVLSEALQKSRVAEQFGVTWTPRSLQSRIVVSFLEGPEIMSVQVSGENPEAVTAFADALGEVYVRKSYEDEKAKFDNRMAGLRRRLVHTQEGQREGNRGPNLAEQLHDKRAELQAAEKREGLDDSATLLAKFQAAQEQLRTARNSASTKRLELSGLEVSLGTKQSQLRNYTPREISDSEALDTLNGNPDYQQLLVQIRQKKLEIEDIKDRFTRAAAAKHLETPQAELRQLNNTRIQMMGAARERLVIRAEAQDKEILRKEIDDLKERIAATKQQSKTLDDSVHTLMVQVEGLKAGGPKAPPHVIALRDQVKQLELEQTQVGMELAALEGVLPLTPRVTMPNKPGQPEMEILRPLKYASAAGVVLFGMVLLGCCLLETRGRRVYASDDLMQGLGMPVLGVLPRLPRSAREKTAQAQNLGGLHPSYGMTEAVDAVRTMLMHAPRVDGARVVMISSATSGEGKSTLASHLAASLARAWRKTLLIDGDLRNPSQHTQFEQPLEPGLCEALRGEVEFEDTIKPTMISRLWVMPAGKIDAHALQALSQEGVASVFEALEEMYDFIVIDSSPVLPVPDALLFGKQADVVLLAVMKDVSRIPAVYQAHQRLESLGIRVLGAVVIGEKTETYGHEVPYPRGNGA